eukprot:TRINITY_DN46543_c0_g1_i1.p1 TRINITY_DN46543_c0_g1~~TRINITY_DN46543_c0_g1_i1.p1  ORF type:complete len:490 (+),score=138.70 TRINITY_DN46543_c0_g1_i1:25-1494(+)
MSLGVHPDEARAVAALEALQAAQEALSVKGLVELQRLEEVSPAVFAVVGAAICLASGPDESALQVDASGVPWASWADLRGLLMKPGHFVTALRRFPYVVESGRLPSNNVPSSRRCFEASDSAEQDSGLVSGLRDWVLAAWTYWEAMGAGIGGSAVLGQQETQMPASPTSVSSRGPPSQRQAQQQAAPLARSSTGSARTSTGSGRAVQPIQGSGAPSRRTSAGSTGGYRQAQPRSSALGVPVRGGATPPTGMTPVAQRASLAHSAISLGSREGGGRTVAAIADYKAQIEQLKKETRDMKAMQNSMKWNMHREEKVLKNRETKKDRKNVLEDNEKWSKEMRALEEENRKEVLEEELADQRKYQEFKRDAKQIAEEEDLKRQNINYLEQKDASEWNAELRRSQHLEHQKLIVEEHLEQTNFLAEYKLEEQQQLDFETRKDRTEQEYMEMQLAFMKAQKARDAAMEGLEFARAAQQFPVSQNLHLPTSKAAVN